MGRKMPRKGSYKDWPEEVKERKRERVREYARRNRGKWKEYSLKYKFGLTLEEYTKMLNAQNNACAICGEQDNRALSVDHDHATGMVRSLLCTKCNSGLGQFKDNADLLELAAEYIRAHNDKYRNIDEND